MKITILGDIMCEPPILKASKCKDGSYNFDDTFAKIRPMLQEADYVIGNMEFPCAGEEAGYTNGFFSFNAPDSFAKAIKDAGIDLVVRVMLRGLLLQRFRVGSDHALYANCGQRADQGKEVSHTVVNNSDHL